MLSQRMDKLESDLELLITMHDLFLQSDTESVIDETQFGGSSQVGKSFLNNDLPERDTAKNHTKSRETVGEISKLKTTTVTSLENKLCAGEADNKTNDKHDSTGSHLSQSKNENEANLQKEIDTLKAQVSQEKCSRSQVEESAKHVYVQLHKVQDELKREKEIRETLLVESLELKNLLQSSRAENDSLKSKLESSQAELHQMSSKVQVVSTEKANLVQRLMYLCQELGLARCVDASGIIYHRTGESYDKPVYCYVDLLKNHINELRKRCNNKGDGIEQIRKLSNQLNSTVDRCAALEKERDRIKSDLVQAHERENRVKNQLHMCQMNVHTFESDLLKKQIEFECIIQKLKSESQMERDKFALKVEEYSSVIKKSKGLLITLREERDQSRKMLQNVFECKRGLERQITSLTEDRKRLVLELDKFKKKIGEMSQEKWTKSENWQMEKLSLEMGIKKYSAEKRKCMELLSEMKNQLVNLKSKHEHASTLFQIEKDKLTSENKRLDENFRVLQKVSEDQGQTIQKLRNDMENLKACNLRLDSQIRDYEVAENELIKKLNEYEKQGERYVRYIDELEEKLQNYSEELRNHDCDDFVNSKYKNKVDEIEEKMRRQMREWQLSFDEMKIEKEEAICNAKIMLEKMENMRKSHEEALAQVKSKLEAELKEANESFRKNDQTKVTLIRELQTQLNKMKASSQQIQQALSMKIKQLQAALGICLGNGGSVASTGNLNAGSMMFGRGGTGNPFIPNSSSGGTQDFCFDYVTTLNSLI